MLCIILKLFILLSVYIQVVQSQVTVTLATANPTNTREIELRCTYTGASSCCSLDRIWSRNADIIMTNGASSSSTKYKERITASSKYFSLQIYNLSDSDLSKAYTCQYGLSTNTLTLTRDHTFIYLPEASCPMTNNKRHISGTLNVTKCQPSPTFVAYYKNTSWTNFLSKTSLVSYDTFYYTQSATLDLPDGLTCGNEETFTLTVITGTVETVICHIDFCKCDECAGKCIGWSFLGTTVTTIVILILVCIVPSLAVLTITKKVVAIVVTFLISALLNVPVAYLIGLKVCPCIDGSDPWFILLGVGTCAFSGDVILEMMNQNGVIATILRCIGKLSCEVFLEKMGSKKNCWFPLLFLLQFIIWILFGVMTAGIYFLVCVVFYICHLKKEGVQDKNKNASISGSKSDNGKSYELTRQDSPGRHYEENN